MAIIPRQPFSDMERFFEDNDWLLPVLPHLGAMKPAMDVYETEKDVIAEVNIPDFDPEKVDVAVKDGVLKIVMPKAEIKPTTSRVKIKIKESK